jgi:glycosyltransferase involved in cell wall biosynthesis
MKITIVLGAFFPVPPIMGGAVEKAWFSLGKEFARRGHEVVQISRAMPSLVRIEVIDGVTHRRIRGYDTPPSLVKLKFLDLLYSIRAFFVLPKADILVTNSFWLPILLRNSRRGKIYVHVARFPKGQMRFYRHVDRLQTVSTSIANAIRHEAPTLQEKISVVPYPLPHAMLADSPKSPSERAKLLLYVGRIHPEKGIHLLIESLTLLDEDWKGVIVGSPETRLGGGGDDYFLKLREDAKRLRCEVTWPGPIFDETALAKQYRSARLFVYPSLAERGETFGLAPLEAMANGCPVLVSNLACFRDFVRPNDTGFVFDHRAKSPVAALSQKIAAVLANEATLAVVAASGLRESRSFAVENVGRKYLNDFQETLRTSTSQPCS